MNLIRTSPVTLILFLAACASTPGAGPPGTATPARVAAETPLLRAVGGDTVYLVHHHVRPERRVQFEAFVQEILWPALRQSAAGRPAGREIERSIRLLQPLTADRDGVYTYTFVLDPYVPGESYTILDILRAVYPEVEAVRQYSSFTETWARDFTTHAFVQARQSVRR
jgi:hypothetical protein